VRLSGLEVLSLFLESWHAAHVTTPPPQGLGSATLLAQTPRSSVTDPAASRSAVVRAEINVLVGVVRVG
jgi:hypothetical protein